MAPRFLEKIQTLALSRHCEMRVNRLCTFCVLAVVISDYIALMADDKLNNDLNEILSALFNDAVNC